MPPSVQDEQSAIELDELLVVHSRFAKMMDDKQKAASR